MTNRQSNTLANTHKASIEELRWGDVRDKVAAINPELAEIIDFLKPSDEFTLFRARYPYGSTISDYGELHLPNSQGNVVSIHDKSIPEDTRNKLSYNPVPLAMVTNNNTEVYTVSDNRLIPFRMFTEGELFGTWELLDPDEFKQETYNWSISAGARSIFMLPKISDASSHRRLRAKYGVSLATPKYFSDHHEIFTKIANHNEFPHEWHNEIIFFSQKWVEGISQLLNNKWTALYFFILKEAWEQSLNWRNQLNTELIWQSLSVEMSRRNMHPRHYLVNTVKHLINLGIGTTPAFAPVIDDKVAPIAGLQTAYARDYALKYNPTIIATTHMGINKIDKHVYYSLQAPSLLTYAPSASHSHSAMKDIQEIKYLMDILLSRLKADDSPSYQLISNINFKYFHTEPDPQGYTESVEKIITEDSRFSSCCNSKGKLPVADSASFLRGGIRISRA